MAIDIQHLNGIRLQAERVCGAYEALRKASSGLDFTSGEYPIGRLAELFQQVRQLAHWLEPSADEAAQAAVERGIVTTFKLKLKLINFGENKVAVIKAVKKHLGIDTQAAKELVESAPVMLNVPADKLNELRTDLEKAGAEIGDTYLGDQAAAADATRDLRSAAKNVIAVSHTQAVSRALEKVLDELETALDVDTAAIIASQTNGTSLPLAALNRAHVLVITARSHAIRAQQLVTESRDWNDGVAQLDTLAKQIDLIEDVLCENEGPLDDSVSV